MFRCLSHALVACILILGLSGCGVPGLAVAPTPTPTCAELARPYAEQLDAILRRWQDASNLALQTPRASLPQQIANLQEIRRDAQDVPVPDCLKTAHDHLIAGMDRGIQGFLGFLGQADQTNVNLDFTVASARFDRYMEEMAKVIIGYRSGSAPASSAEGQPDK